MATINWQTVKEYEDITFKKCDGVMRIAFNRPEVRNAFRPKTVFELLDAFQLAEEDREVGVILLTGEGPSAKDGGWAFCSGGDQRVRGAKGYEGQDGVGRLNILEVQRLIRFSTKVVVAVVNGWAVGGGHSLHVVCDMTLASKEHAIFKQTDADVASFDGGYGSAYLAKQVGQKRAREIFFLGLNYSAQEAYDMGMVNLVVPHDELEQVAFDWAQEILTKSPTAIKMLKYAFNLVDDGLVGQLKGKADQSVPAVGFAMGMERLLLLLEQVEQAKPVRDCEVFLLAEPAYQAKALVLAEQVRDQLEAVNSSIRFKTGSQGSMKSQMKKADQSGAIYAVILGEREWESQQLLVKELATGEQSQVAVTELTAFLLEKFKQ